MEEKNLEESVTSENTHEEESTSTNDESTEEQDYQGVEDEQADVLEKNRQLYARVKKAEAEKKKLEAMVEAQKATKTEKSVPASGDNTPNVFELAKQVNALKDYSAEELEVIDRQAKAFGMSHLEASKHEDVQTLISAKREKLKELNSVPAPSSRQSADKVDVSQLSPIDIAKLNPGNTNDLKIIEAYNQYRRTVR